MSCPALCTPRGLLAPRCARCCPEPALRPTRQLQLRLQRAPRLFHALAGNWPLVNALLEWGAALNPPGGLGGSYPWLCRLSRRSHVQRSFSGWPALVQRLVAAGASIEDQDDGVPPLACLAYAMGWTGCRHEAHFQLLAALRAQGADGSSTDEDGCTAQFHLAAGMAPLLPGEGGDEEGWRPTPVVDVAVSCPTSHPS